MSYFAPYIDSAGIHIPTYEDRLTELESAYRSIFGIEAGLDPAVPDYQLLSVFARALDDTSALVLQAYNSRNPMYASGRALDLLLPQYGLARQAGETDAEARARIRSSLSQGTGSYDALVAALLRVPAADMKYRLYVNEGNTTDGNGIPGHSVALVSLAGNTARLAQALFDAKAPGIGTYGSTEVQVQDANGNPHTVSFSRPEYKLTYVYPYIKKLPGADETAIREAVVPAVMAYIDGLEIGGTLNIPKLYGVIYAAKPEIANTFVVTDIQACFAGDQSMTTDLLQCGWREMFYAGSAQYPNVEIRFSE
jgi:hypothetical protein